MASTANAKLITLLKQYSDIFAWTYDEMLGLDPSLVTHHLDIFSNSKPIKQHAQKYHLDLEAKIKEEGIEVDRDKIKSIMEMLPPQSQKALKKFLGKLSYLRRFIPALAEITFSFGTLLKENHKFEWLQEHQ
ncbi:uncharacterized protein LOC114264889 [Camellia sinensis]|uniref:uncharacterized protein LOC114264889 n=1 Tax=Camellia sinensis TaxID=4442 RepID=UPI001036B00B|nr:uncharacterized protein LOC114264889 [Camellia sinensis]